MRGRRLSLAGAVCALSLALPLPLPLQAQTPPPAQEPAKASAAAAQDPPPTAEHAQPPTDAMPFQPNLPVDPSRQRGSAPNLRIDAENGVAFPTDI